MPTKKDTLLRFGPALIFILFVTTPFIISFFYSYKQTEISTQPDRTDTTATSTSTKTAEQEKAFTVHLKKFPLCKNTTLEQYANVMHHRTSQILHSVSTNAATDSALPIYSFMNAQYYCEITAGSNDQKFTAIIDTGSPVLWFPSIKCVNLSCLIHRRYDAAASRTAVPSDDACDIRYGSGQVSGHWVADTVSLGAVTVRDFEFVAVTEQKGYSWIFLKPDAIIGFSYACRLRDGEKARPTFFQRLVSDGVIDRAVFSVMLERARADGSGELIVGGYSERYFTGEIAWLEVLRPLYWQVAFKGARVNGTEIKGSTSAVFDTGTSLVILPEVEAKRINELIGAKHAGRGIFSIDDAHDLPVVELLFEGVTLNFKPEDYVLDLGIVNTRVSAFAFVEGLEFDFWLFGAALLKAFYTVYDMERNLLGVAEARRV